MNARSLPNFSYLQKMGYELNAVNSTTTELVSTRLSAAGLSLVGLTTLTTAALFKRDIFNASIKPSLLIRWNSDLGTHVGEHIQQNLNVMVEDIVNDTNTGSLDSTLRYTNKLNL